MIALDTNILLRYFAQDGGVQVDIATRLIEEDLSPTAQGFVSLVVICEPAWSLKQSYRQERVVVAEALTRLLSSRQIVVESAVIVKRAITEQNSGIADAIIHLTGHANGCTKTVTFDKKFALLEGVELLSA
jgi:predicted nucleic-acid-binding protein